jgi:hypothetical protein
VEAIDECELHTPALGFELREPAMRRQLEEVDDGRESGARQVVQTDARPQWLGVLARVHDDVSRLLLTRERIADGERRAAHGEPDLERRARLQVPHHPGQELGLIGQHVGLQRHTSARGRGRNAGADELFEDWVHGVTVGLLRAFGTRAGGVEMGLK